MAAIKKALKRHGSSKAITTDGLRSNRAAMNEIGNAGKQEIGRWANNRCEGTVKATKSSRFLGRIWGLPVGKSATKSAGASMQ